MPTDTEKQNAGLLITWARIASYLGVCVGAAVNWHKRHGLPVAYLPDGRRATSRSLVDAWLLARTNNDLRETGGATGLDQVGNSEPDQ
jgi:hypothetical protein